MARINLSTIFSQTDPRWSSKFLGTNTVLPYNIYNYGCLLSDLATSCKYYGVDIDPARLNDALLTKQGFVGGGNYVWGTLPKLYPQLSEKKTDTPNPLTDAQISEIKNALDVGHYVIFEIDYNPSTVAFNSHYVGVVDYDPGDENNFTIADPLGGKLHSLKDYLGLFAPNARKDISQYIIISGPVPQPIPVGPSDDQKRALGLLESFKTANNYGNDEGCINGLIGAFGDLKTTKDSLRNVQAGLDSANTQISTLNLQIAGLSDDKINLNKQVTQLLSDKADLVKQLNDCKVSSTLPVPAGLSPKLALVFKILFS